MIPLHIADQAVAACEAEIATLKKAKASSDIMHDAKNATIQGLVEERDGLLNDIERLRRAGDAMELLITYSGIYIDGPKSGLLKAWNSAKEDSQ
jgi:hypothetical protein